MFFNSKDEFEKHLRRQVDHWKSADRGLIGRPTPGINYARNATDAQKLIDQLLANQIADPKADFERYLERDIDQWKTMAETWKLIFPEKSNSYSRYAETARTLLDKVRTSKW